MEYIQHISITDLLTVDLLYISIFFNHYAIIIFIQVSIDLTLLKS